MRRMVGSFLASANHDEGPTDIHRHEKASYHQSQTLPQLPIEYWMAGLSPSVNNSNEDHPRVTSEVHLQTKGS